MSLPSNLGNPRPLGRILDHLDELPSSGWLYIQKAIREITLALECYPAQIDSHDVSEEETTAFEAAVVAAGFKSFLCSDQLYEIIGNLEEHRADFTPADLEKAIDFYWRHDAFIVLGGDVP